MAASSRTVPTVIPVRDGAMAGTSRDRPIVVERLITSAEQDASLVFGLIHWEAGASSSWSFDDGSAAAALQVTDTGTKRWGASDEVYFMLEGELIITWAGNGGNGELRCVASQVAYFPRGYVYTVTALTNARAVYAVAPPIR